MSMIRFTTSGLLVILAMTGSASWAYYDVLDTGEITAKGSYKLTGDTQFLTDTGGANVGAVFDAGFQEAFGVRAEFGGGRTDYFGGGMVKWVPIPDVQGQPAVGFNAGLLYAHWNDTRELTFRWEPLVSKKFPFETVTLTPYASLPLGLRARNSDTHPNGTDLSIQLAVGSQIKIDKIKNLQFMTEVGLNLGNSLSYFTIAGVYYFDEEHGFTWEK